MGLVSAMVLYATAVSAESPTLDSNQLLELAPQLAPILEIAAMNPVLAASLVPDPWIDSLLSGALALQAEVPASPAAPDAPRDWPVGPWRTSKSLVGTIESVNARSVTALLRALRPRMSIRCRKRGAQPADCERALRVSGSRLAAGAVLSRASGGSPAAITSSQRELARLGVPVVVAMRTSIRRVGIGLWGPSWKADP